MSQITVEVQRRTPGGKNANRRLRSSGQIPAVVYGPGKQSVAIMVYPQNVTDILCSESGRNTIFTVSVDGKERANAMVKDYQLDPVKGKLIHVDFLEIAMDQLLELTVNIEIVGEPIGVKLDGGHHGYRHAGHRGRMPASRHSGIDQGRCQPLEDQRLHPSQRPSG